MQGRLKSASENEKLSKEECIDLRRRLSSLETEFRSATHEVEMLRVELEQQKTEKIMAEQELKKYDIRNKQLVMFM